MPLGKTFRVNLVFREQYKCISGIFGYRFLSKHCFMTATSHSVMVFHMTGNPTICSIYYQFSNKENIKAPHHSPLPGKKHQPPVVSPHKGSVMQKTFPCHNVVLFFQFAVVAFSLYIGVSGNDTLSASVAFVSLSLLGSLTRPLTFLPTGIANFVQVGAV